MSQIEERLAAMGLELPPPFKEPVGVRVNHLPVRISGDTVYVSSQGPMWAQGVRYRGKIGEDLTREEGYEAARMTALNTLRMLKDELGDLDRVKRWLKVRGFVNCVPSFTWQSNVMNGYSDLIVELYGEERGKHSRTVIGACSLPFGSAVDAEAVVEIEAKA